MVIYIGGEYPVLSDEAIALMESGLEIPNAASCRSLAHEVKLSRLLIPGLRRVLEAKDKANVEKRDLLEQIAEDK